MKIAILYNQVTQQGGGMDRYFRELVTGFTNSGDEVTVYVFKTDHSKLPAKVVLAKSSLLPGRLKKIFFIKSMNKKFMPQAYDISIALTRTACQDITVCGGTHKGFLAHMQQKPGLYDKFEINSEIKSFENAKWIMAHSEIMAKEISELYNIPKEKIVTLYPPVTSMASADEININKIKEELQINSTDTNLLFPSVGHKFKNLSNLAKAVNKLPENFKLWIIGKPPKSIELTNNIRYLGYRKDINTLYHLMDFTVLPSIYEPFGMVAIESISAGTPVIVSDKVGCSTLIKKEDGFIFNDISPEGIYRAILSAVRNIYSPNQSICEDNNLTVAKHIAVIKQTQLNYV